MDKLFMFRIWEDNQLIYWSQLKKSPLARLNNDNIVVEQYTGIRDVDNNPIYEGDVVIPVEQDITFWELVDLDVEPIEVKKNNYLYGLKLARDTNGDIYKAYNYYYGKDLRIVGNIHRKKRVLVSDKFIEWSDRVLTNNNITSANRYALGVLDYYGSFEGTKAIEAGLITRNQLKDYYYGYVEYVGESMRD